MKHFIFFLILITFKTNICSASTESKILMSVGNQIITSYELKNRVKTILILSNKELNQDNVNRTKNQALNFLINFKLNIN